MRSIHQEREDWIGQLAQAILLRRAGTDLSLGLHTVREAFWLAETFVTERAKRMKAAEEKDQA